MGGGSSKVTSIEDHEEIARRVMHASDDRHHLTRMSLSIGTLNSNASTLLKMNQKLLKNAEHIIDKKDPYTKSIQIKKGIVKQKKAEIEDLKNAEALVENLMNTLGPLKDEISTLVHGYTAALGQMDSSREGHIYKMNSMSDKEKDDVSTGRRTPTTQEGPLMNSFVGPDVKEGPPLNSKNNPETNVNEAVTPFVVTPIEDDPS